MRLGWDLREFPVFIGCSFKGCGVSADADQELVHGWSLGDGPRT